MGRDLTREDILGALRRFDPVWSLGSEESRNYDEASQMIHGGLGRILGVGHIATVVADALDRVQPGVYEKYRQPDSEVRQRILQIARELWEIRGIRVPRPTPATSPVVQAALPPPPGTSADTTALIEWLRNVEDQLAQIPPSVRSTTTPVAVDFRAHLSSLVTEYAHSDAPGREKMRDAFSRFRLVLYQLWMFVSEQYVALKEGTDRGSEAMHVALWAESLLDRGTDWRDELLLLRSLRALAAGKGLAIDDAVARAASLSSPETARLLLSVVERG